MKTDKAVFNVILNVIVQVLNIVLTLAVRRMFLLILGNDVLALNSLYASILSFMALSELGIGTTISAVLYKPLAQNDKRKIAAYMCMLKKSYIFIGFFIMTTGIAVQPILPWFIKGDFEPVFICISFELYVISSAVTYFFSYKKILIGADQKNYIISASQAIYKIVLNLSQFIVLVTTKNYCIFIVTAIICNFVENFVISKLCDSMYSYINSSTEKLSREEKKELGSKIFGILCCKAGSYLIEGTDNIIISAILGTVAVAHYNNFYLIINLLYAVFANVATSSIAGLGNILYTDKERMVKIFSKLMLMQQFVFSFSSAAFLVMSSFFVKTVFTGTPVYEFSVLFFMTVIYYIKGYSQGIEAIRGCAGEYSDKNINLALSVCNLIISVVLANKIGIVGVLIGTLICYGIKGLITVPTIVFQKILPEGRSSYYFNVVKNTGITAIIMVSVKVAESVYPINSWMKWIFYGILIFIFSAAINVAFVYKTDEYRELKEYCLGVFSRIRGRIIGL